MTAATISEITAIVEYLDEQPGATRIVGNTPEERAETRMWARRIDLYILEPMANAFRASEGRPMFASRMTLVSLEAAAELKAIAQEKLLWLDTQLQGRNFVCGDRYSMADVLLLGFPGIRCQRWPADAGSGDLVARMAQARGSAPQRRGLNPARPMAIAAARGRPRWLFARGFFADPRRTGSVIPSSQRLTAQLLAGLDLPRARVVVEFGPGTGVVTRALLAGMAPDAQLFAFEINDDFVAYLRQSITDPRLTIIAASAETVEAVLAAHGHEGCCAAVSSLPFSIMPAAVRATIVSATARALRPGGVLVGYQYSKAWLGELRHGFGEVAVRFEPRNWPPAFVFSARQR